MISLTVLMSSGGAQDMFIDREEIAIAMSESTVPGAIGRKQR